MDKHTEWILNLTDKSPIEDLDLPVRAFNVLKAQNCNTLGDLKLFFDRISSGEKIKGIATGTIKDIEVCLEEIDIAKENMIKKQLDIAT